MKGWLYSVEEPEGKIFGGEDYDAAVALGWVDSPALISQIEVEPIKNKGGRPKKEKL